MLSPLQIAIRVSPDAMRSQISAATSAENSTCFFAGLAGAATVSERTAFGFLGDFGVFTLGFGGIVFGVFGFGGDFGIVFSCYFRRNIARYSGI
jgi:hypothetical protein